MDPNSPTIPVPPVTTPAPDVPPVTTPTTPPASPSVSQDGTVDKNAMVLEVLKGMGHNLESVDSLSSLLSAYQAEQDGKKSELQKAQEKIGKLEPLAMEVDNYRKLFAQLLDDEKKRVPEQHRKDLDSILVGIPKDTDQLNAIRQFNTTIQKLSKPGAPNIDAGPQTKEKTTSGAPTPEARKRIGARFGIGSR